MRIRIQIVLIWQLTSTTIYVFVFIPLVLLNIHIIVTSTLHVIAIFPLVTPALVPPDARAFFITQPRAQLRIAEFVFFFSLVS